MRGGQERVDTFRARMEAEMFKKKGGAAVVCCVGLQVRPLLISGFKRAAAAMFPLLVDEGDLSTANK